MNHNEITTLHGVRVRNIKQVAAPLYHKGVSYSFEALIDSQWIQCGDPLPGGSFTLIPGTDNYVRVGRWELEKIWRTQNTNEKMIF